jgi:hypothetical protein
MCPCKADLKKDRKFSGRPVFNRLESGQNGCEMSSGTKGTRSSNRKEVGSQWWTPT